ncbi:MAG: ATP-binding protein [Paludibacteraceae bacterium]|nr:ATP-binding protein [Paludibacteraceae bacterium]
MYKVGIIGPEASGKSTLAAYLAKRYSGILVAEYARTYIEQKGTMTVSYEELCEIAKHQITEIEQAENTCATGSNAEVAFFDTELIVTKVWFDYAFGHVPEWLSESLAAHPMDVYLLTKPDLPWVQDGARYNGSQTIRMLLYERYEQEIQSLGVPYYIIEHV